MSLKLPVKYVIWVIVVALLLGAAVAGYISCRCDGGTPAMPQYAEAIPPGWEAPPVETTPWLPFKKNKASEYTAEFPPGSKVVVVETPEGEEVEIGILPGGQVVVPKGAKATVYEKREAFIAAHFRPFIGAGAVGPQLDYAVAAGADVLRVWKVDLGVGALINDDAVAGAAFAAYPVWGNIDARAGGGYGTQGGVGFVGVTIGIK